MWSTIYSKLLCWFHWFVRPVVKWFLRRTTKLCELQRICYGAPPGAVRDIGVETSLELSRTKAIKELLVTLDCLSTAREFYSSELTIEYAVMVVADIKSINTSIHWQFVDSFSTCLHHIWGYRQLVHEVESLRTTAYDYENPAHEAKLLRLWSLLMPSEMLMSRVTKQWQSIGFQGDDPKTDFRGMGILGLDNLLFFVTEYPDAAQHVLAHSHHPKFGYDFAIVGINLTSMAYDLVKDGSAKTHMYNVAGNSHVYPSMHVFHKFYCYLFYQFDKYWIEAKPKNIMDFSNVRGRFEKNIRLALANQSALFRINISIDNI